MSAKRGRAPAVDDDGHLLVCVGTHDSVEVRNESGAAIANGTYTDDVDFSESSTITVAWEWTNNNGAESIYVQIFGRLGATGTWHDISAAFTAVGGTLGAGGAQQNDEIIAYLTAPPLAMDEIRLSYTKAGAVAGNDSMVITYKLG